MLDLQEIRKEIDQIDKQIVALYERRMEISKQVAEYKIATGKKVFDKEREDEKIKAVKQLASNDFNRHGVAELFIQLMSMSRKLQYKLLIEKGKCESLPFLEVEDLNIRKAKVVYQGVEGAYAQIAMKAFFGEEIENYCVDTWREAMEEITNGKADFAVLPIENSSAGSVNDNYDLMVEFNNYIVGEQVIKVEHALIGLPDASISDIKTVYSHPQGLMQSSKFLDEHREWNRISSKNTALSALKVLEDNDISQAAIASKEAAEIYGLKILQSQINFSDKNSTRFIIVTSQKIFTEDADKISICFEVPHESGSLYNILSHFIYNDLNMTKIESRPIENRNWEYRFFIDFEGNLKDYSVKNALQGILEEASELKILGNYKKYKDEIDGE